MNLGGPVENCGAVGNYFIDSNDLITLQIVIFISASLIYFVYCLHLRPCFLDDSLKHTAYRMIIIIPPFHYSV